MRHRVRAGGSLRVESLDEVLETLKPRRRPKIGCRPDLSSRPKHFAWERRSPSHGRQRHHAPVAQCPRTQASSWRALAPVTLVDAPKVVRSRNVTNHTRIDDYTQHMETISDFRTVGD